MTQFTSKSLASSARRFKCEGVRFQRTQPIITRLL